MGLERVGGRLTICSDEASSRLHEKLLIGGYSDFRNEYLAAPTAFYTRALLQPRLDVRTDRNGTMTPESAYGNVFNIRCFGCCTS